MATVENFVVKVTTQGVEQLNRLASAADSVNGKMGALSSTILGVGFGAFVLGAAQAADAMADLSDASGLTLGSITAFGLALEASGGKFKNTEKTILAFYNALETAADGGLKQQEAFKKVGVSLDDLRNMSEADIMNKTIAGLAKMGEGSERSALAATLLGRSFRSVAPDKFAEELAKAGTKAAEMAANQQKLADFNQTLESSYRALQLAVADVFGPLLESFKGIEAGSVTAKAAIIGFTGALAIVVGGQVASGMLALIDLYKKLSGAIKGAAIAQTAMVALSGPKGWAIIAGAAAVAAGAYVALDKAMSDAAETAKTAPGAPTGVGTVTSKTPNAGPAGRTVTVAKTQEQKAAEESARRVAQINEEINRLRTVQTSDVLNQIQQIEIAKASDIAKARAEIFAKENLGKAQATIEFEAKRTEIALKAETEIAKLRAEAGRTLNEQVRSYSLSVADKEREIALNKELNGLSVVGQQKRRETLEVERNMLAAIEQARLVRNADPADTDAAIQRIRDQAAALRESIDANIEYQNSFEAGWARAFNSYLDNATNASKQAEAMFQSMTSNMNSAIDQFVDNGKFSFNDLATSMIKDILKIQMKAAAANLFAASGLGSIFGVQARAQGGPVNPNTPYLVGEQGPELFMPKSAGSIVPNNKMGSGGGGGSNTYITNNISAIDSKSVAQLFAENRQQLFGNVEQARRELPLRTR